MKRIALAVLLLLCSAVSAGLVYSRPLPSALAAKASLFGTAASSGLDMRVDPHGDGSLLVSWNAHSASVDSAEHGVLEVDDGLEHRKVQLDSNELANGSILYTPTSADVVFRLEIFERNGSPTSESMRVVKPLGSGWAPHTITNAGPSSSAKTTPDAPEARHSAATTSHAKRTPATAAPKTTPDIKVQATRNPAATGSAEVSGRERSSIKTDPSPARQDLRKAVRDLPSPPSRVTSAQPSAMKNSGANATKYVPARPVKRVMPSARNLDFSTGSAARDVEVAVRIDEQGRVTEARVVNNGSKANGLLTSAALTAAKEWVFEPAKMHGKNVPGDHTIEFHFRPQAGQQ